MGIKNFLAARPQTAEQVADHLDLYHAYISSPPRRMVDRLDGPPLPYTVHIKRTLAGMGATVPSQMAHYDRGYYAADGSDIKIGGILWLTATVAKGLELQSSLVIPEFTHQAIGGAVMDLIQGRTAPDQAERLLEASAIYPSSPSDPCGLSSLSKQERQEFMHNLDDALTELHERTQSGQTPEWFAQLPDMPPTP